MATTSPPGELVERVRKDAERNVLRVRNGLKHLAGVGRPQLDPDAQGDRLVVGEGRAVALRERPSHDPHAAAVRPQPRVESYVFDLVPGNSFVETMVDRGFDVYLVDWGVPDELEAGNTLETYTDDYLPTIIERGRARSPAARTSTCSATASAACCRCWRVAGNPDLPVRSLAVMATPVDFTHMGPMTTMMQEGRVEPDRPLDATGNVPADVMLNSFRVLTAARRRHRVRQPAGRTCGTTSSSPPTR